jgi:hypothetical protein
MAAAVPDLKEKTVWIPTPPSSRYERFKMVHPAPSRKMISLFRLIIITDSQKPWPQFFDSGERKTAFVEIVNEVSH